jgi:hypothetical protein
MSLLFQSSKAYIFAIWLLSDKILTYPDNIGHAAAGMLVSSCLAALFICPSSPDHLTAQNQTANITDSIGLQTGDNNSGVTFETFFAKGLIGSLIVDNNITNATSSTVQKKLLAEPVGYILAGNWSLDVVDQKLENFEINFTMVHPDGSDWHYHEISNFEPDFGIPILLDPGGTTIVGMSDVGEDNMDKWFGVQTTLVISNLNTITIFLDPSDTDNHFSGQSIYGIVQSLMNENRSLLTR